MEETAQELTDHVSQFQKYLDEHTPELISFGIKVVLSIVVLYIGSRLIRWVLGLVRRSLGRTGMDKGAVQFLCSFLKALLYILLIFGIGMNFGIKESSVAALLGTAGVTIGLALQGGLSNLAGGVMLLIFKPFQVGDYIIVDKANGWEGTVYKIEICYTTLLSVDYRHIVIPNGTLSGNTVVNLTARDMRKLELKIGISYDSDMHKAKQILEQIIKDDKGTREDQGMLVYVDELAESAVTLGLRVWVPTEDYWTVRWRLNETIKDEFDRQGIRIPYRQLDVHLIS
ncbi:MAG: mechanosensitive ion channel [Blautia glucerasea]|uniref:Mechanosensitive ion channel n=1 Tax=Blautia ammoniilytica TaxID=2981782 RepID=A0ABT2TUD8_9FIRM|nr:MULTISPECIES: mechanosensitive ion channel domain-containing protein [Blautia]MDY3086399.1 mechanosensitive ion channel [Blautia sp.]MCI7628638.1 mechanosensitive ion channel [Blautia glucerasea]MCU6765059.1 mechanosensitive ion channel [Blautia ammoniilytica]NSJ27148.1 mechanosensitive ion channel [Blautia glucerasea]SCH81772.1 Small-conductance mechanosensitive channel [uncultured Blautia sp.]